MKKYTEKQIVAILREAEAAEATAREVCRKHGITAQA